MIDLRKQILDKNIKKDIHLQLEKENFRNLVATENRIKEIEREQQERRLSEKLQILKEERLNIEKRREKSEKREHNRLKEEKDLNNKLKEHLENIIKTERNNKKSIQQCVNNELIEQIRERHEKEKSVSNEKYSEPFWEKMWRKKEEESDIYKMNKLKVQSYNMKFLEKKDSWQNKHDEGIENFWSERELKEHQKDAERRLMFEKETRKDQLYQQKQNVEKLDRNSLPFKRNYKNYNQSKI